MCNVSAISGPTPLALQGASADVLAWRLARASTRSRQQGMAGLDLVVAVGADHSRPMRSGSDIRTSIRASEAPAAHCRSSRKITSGWRGLRPARGAADGTPCLKRGLCLGRAQRRAGVGRRPIRRSRLGDDVEHDLRAGTDGLRAACAAETRRARRLAEQFRTSSSNACPMAR